MVVGWWAVGRCLVGWRSALSGSALTALACLTRVSRFLGTSVRYDIETEAEAEHRTSQNWKPKPNRKTELPTIRFGSLFGFR